jgi:superfamily II DNA/RNA helicase
MQSFEQLRLSPSTLNALAAMGFETPTPVQGQSIPVLMEDRDLIAQARTGTGKTAAFGIPLVERRLAENWRGVGALVLVPTRELALQVTEELAKIAQGAHLRVVAVYGGVGFGPQANALRGNHPMAVVATPGRLLDHLQQGTVNLDGVRMLVLDEADRMLDMGFLPDVERVLAAVSKDRQTALFSATLPEPIRRLVHKFMHAPQNVKVETDGPTVAPLAEQFRIDIPQHDKARALLALLTKEKPTSTIVFTRTKHLARRLARTLDGAGHRAVALQGNMSQSQRERALGAFRNGQATVLVATDIASRGLDIPDVSHIVNFDLPAEPEAYVHRVGRTARMGRTGRAFTFVQPNQARDLRDVERTAGLQLGAYELGELPPAPPRLAPDAEDRAHMGGRHQGGHRGPPRHQGQRGHGQRRDEGRGPPRQGAQPDRRMGDAPATGYFPPAGGERPLPRQGRGPKGRGPPPRRGGNRGRGAGNDRVRYDPDSGRRDW